MDVRFVCRDCGVKWFVRASSPSKRQPSDCGSCGGLLIPLLLAVEAAPPLWDVDEEPFP